MGIIGWILLGFLAGVIAKAIMPGAERGRLHPHDPARRSEGRCSAASSRPPSGFGDPIDEFFDLSTWVAAVVGALVILFVWNAIGGRRIA